jgi:hypothetical protein
MKHKPSEAEKFRQRNLDPLTWSYDRLETEIMSFISHVRTENKEGRTVDDYILEKLETAYRELVRRIREASDR